MKTIRTNGNSRGLNSFFGFSVIELVVVMAMIGLLLAIVLASFNDARLKARNAKRISDLTQIQLALEHYYDDRGEYPRCTTTDTSTCNNSICICITANDDYAFAQFSATTELIPYLPQIPQDPTDSAGSQGYDYTYARGYRKTGPTTLIQTNLKDDYVLIGRYEPNQSTVLTGPSNLLNSRQFRNILLGSE